MKIEFDSWLTLITAFGSPAVVIASLTAWLGNICAKRILQRESAKFAEQLASINHELKLRESSYAKYLDLLLDYYDTFYRHYRLCQNAANQDAHRMPDGSVIKTKDIFFEQLDAFLSESKAKEGKARLILPPSILALHEASISAFNAFKDAMTRDNYDPVFHAQTDSAFARVHAVKQSLEEGLRNFLRTERLIKTKP